ncbi:hypothetical protein K0M31_012866 [Melipona bicolor]|uniref:Uncharacterized protein n=1 Tax=Melipona bicolor TaxID=60889 RepID=A0AA40FJB5_9HYME|nr:hypothetical protein K0M31_012866 [Melipona bicolor]
MVISPRASKIKVTMMDSPLDHVVQFECSEYPVAQASLSAAFQFSRSPQKCPRQSSESGFLSHLPSVISPASSASIALSLSFFTTRLRLSATIQFADSELMITVAGQLSTREYLSLRCFRGAHFARERTKRV